MAFFPAQENEHSVACDILPSEQLVPPSKVRMPLTVHGCLAMRDCETIILNSLTLVIIILKAHRFDAAIPHDVLFFSLLDVVRRSKCICN